MPCLVRIYDRLRAWCNPASVAYGCCRLRGKHDLDAHEEYHDKFLGEALVPHARMEKPPMPSWLYTDSSQQAIEKWRSDPERYWLPSFGIFAAFPHLWTRRSFFCFYGLVIAIIICVFRSPEHEVIFNKVFGILALIVVIPCTIRSLRHLILPWKATVMEYNTHIFGIPFVPFDIGAHGWLLFGTVASSLSVWFKMTSWGALAFALSSQENFVRISAKLMLVLGFIMPVKEVIFSLPAWKKRHDNNYNEVPFWGTRSVAQGVVEFQEGSAENVEKGETMFCTFAEHLTSGMWCSTHFESYINYGCILGDWFAAAINTELPQARINAMYRRDDFYKDGHCTLTKKLNLRVLRQLKLILKHRVQSTTPTIILSTVPKLLTQILTVSCSESGRGVVAWMGVVTGFLSFAMTYIGGFPTLKKIYQSFSKVQHDLDSSREEVEQRLQKEIDDELESVKRFFVRGFILEFVCGCAFVLLALQAHDDLVIPLSIVHDACTH